MAVPWASRRSFDARWRHVGDPSAGASGASRPCGMTSDASIEQSFPSTTYAWRKVKIARPPEATTQRRRRRLGFLRLTVQPRSRPVRITATYRGGAESWWWIEARGEKEALPGHWSLDDVLARVLSER